MADIDIDPLGEHESRTEEPTNEHNPPVRGGLFVTLAQVHTASGEQETFGGEIHGSVLHKEYLVGEIYELISNKTHQRLEPNLSLFKLGENGRLYYEGKPPMNRNGELKTIGIMADTLGIRGLREMGYNIAKTNLKPRFVLDLLEKQAELFSTSEIAKADTIELEEIAKSTKDLISQISNSHRRTNYLNILYSIF